MNVLAVGKGIQAPRPVGGAYSLEVARSEKEARAKLRSVRPDLVLMDLNMSQLNGGALLRQLVAANPRMPIVVMESSELAARIGLSREAVNRLVRALAELSPRPGAGRESTHAPDRLAHVVLALHDPASGRVDARRVAEFMGLSVTALAKALERSPQSVHKTPDAPGLQEKLSVFVRIVTSLTTLFGSAERGRIWLNAPNTDLDHARPIELIAKRKAEVVADLLEDTLLGHPG